MPPSLTLSTVKSMLRAAGVTRLFAKRLSPNDNSKNQIYLGGDFGVMNVIPAGPPVAATSGKHALPIFKAALQLGWLDADGAVHPAPSAQLILYPQYPEVRLSGFLRGSRSAPADVLTSRAPGRVLLLGLRPSSEIVAFAAATNSAVALELLSATHDCSYGVLERVALDDSDRDAHSASKLLSALCSISKKGWIEGWRLLPGGERRSCIAPNCIGVTLESELGIVANGRSEPDFDGWEVKGYGVSSFARLGSRPLTLMTSEPTGGFYHTAGVVAFVSRYGYDDLRGRENRRNFGGVHRVGVVCKRTGLTLAIDGFDSKSGTITRSDGHLALLDAKDRVAASWSFSSLLAHWSRKHARAVFVPGIRRLSPTVGFRFGGEVDIARGTDYLMFLSALADGRVYYDPGIKVLHGDTETSKRRSQFRVSRSKLRSLYHEFTRVSTCEQFLSGPRLSLLPIQQNLAELTGISLKQTS